VQGLKQERILIQGGSAFTIVEQPIQVRGAELKLYAFGQIVCLGCCFAMKFRVLYEGN